MRFGGRLAWKVIDVGFEGLRSGLDVADPPADAARGRVAPELGGDGPRPARVPLHGHPAEKTPVPPVLEAEESPAINEVLPPEAAVRPVPEQHAPVGLEGGIRAVLPGTEEARHGVEEGRGRELHVPAVPRRAQLSRRQHGGQAHVAGGEEVDAEAVRRVDPARPVALHVPALVSVLPLEPEERRSPLHREFGRARGRRPRVGKRRPHLQPGRARPRRQARDSRGHAPRAPRRRPHGDAAARSRRSSRTSSGSRRGAPSAFTQTSSVRARARSSPPGRRWSS